MLNGGHIMQGVIVFVRHHSQWLKSGKVSKRDAFVWDLYMGSMNKASESVVFNSDQKMALRAVYVVIG